MNHPTADALALVRAVHDDNDLLVSVVAEMSTDDLAQTAIQLATLVVMARDIAPGKPLDEWLTGIRAIADAN